MSAINTRHPNAAYGLKMMFAAQIIALIASFSAGLVFLSDWVRELVMVGIMIFAIVLELVGMARAGKDDANYTMAFRMAVLAMLFNWASLALSVISIWVLFVGIIQSIISAFGTIAHVMVLLYVCRGTLNLLDPNGQTAKLGRITMVYYMISYLAAMAAILIASLMNTFLGDFINLATLGIGGIITSIVAACLIVLGGLLGISSEILYIVFLGKAKNRV